MRLPLVCTLGARGVKVAKWWMEWVTGSVCKMVVVVAVQVVDVSPEGIAGSSKWTACRPVVVMSTQVIETSPRRAERRKPTSRLPV